MISNLSFRFFEISRSYYWFYSCCVFSNITYSRLKKKIFHNTLMFIILPMKIGFLKSEYMTERRIAHRLNNFEHDTVDIFAICDKIFEPHINFAAEQSWGWITDEVTHNLISNTFKDTYHFVQYISLYCYWKLHLFVLKLCRTFKKYKK